MQQKAIVTELLPGRIAKLQVQRMTSCGHDCSTCGGCVEVYSKPIVVEAKNTIDAKVGDTVNVESNSKSVLGMAAVVYVIPMILFFAFYAAAAAFHWPVPGVFGVLGIAVGILGAKLYNDYHKKHAKPMYVMSRL